MLMAHPVVLRNLLERYESLDALAHADVVGPQIRRRLDDAAYTLCVSTGTRDIDAALKAARQQLCRTAAPAAAPALAGAAARSATAEPAAQK